jgi:elongation factor G
MDRIGATLDLTVEMLSSRLGAHPIVIQLPIGLEGDFEGVIDLLTMETIHWPDELGTEVVRAPITEEHALYEDAALAREAMIEAVAEVDDELMNVFLESGAAGVELDALTAAMRRVTIANAGVLVLCGSSLKNKGVQPVLDAVIDYLPSPLDMPPVKAIRTADGAEIERHPSPDEPFLALAFKVLHDPHRGPLIFFRVYSGQIKVKDAIQNVTRGRKERLTKILQIHANKTEEIDTVGVGNIAAAVGLRFTSTGDTIIQAKDKEEVTLAGMQIPEPVIFRAVEPKSAADQTALEEAMEKLQREDPSFHVTIDKDSGQTLISGMGELHLDVITDRLAREYRVAANVGKPQVAYRETISAPLTKTVEYDREIGNKRQYARLALKLEPAPRGTGVSFTNSLPIPEPAKGKGKSQRPEPPKLLPEMVAAIEEGVTDAFTRGPILGYPVVDLAVKLTDGAYVEGDSSAASFRAAAAIGMMEAMSEAAPVLLEPTMAVEVLVPEDFTGHVVSDLNGRRGRVQGMNPRKNVQVIEAEVPLASMVGYATALRSATQGRANYSMQFSHYSEVPRDLEETIVKKIRGY